MTLPFIICLILVPIGVGTAVRIAHNRHKRDLRKYLEPDLQRGGMEYVSSAFPGWFKTGPFPEVEIEVGRPQTHAGGTRGEYSEYRIVIFKDGQGGLHQLWALVEFEAFQFRRVRWRAQRKDSLPASVLKILEE